MKWNYHHLNRRNSWRGPIDHFCRGGASLNCEQRDGYLHVGLHTTRLPASTQVLVIHFVPLEHLFQQCRMSASRALCVRASLAETLPQPLERARFGLLVSWPLYVGLCVLCLSELMSFILTLNAGGFHHQFWSLSLLFIYLFFHHSRGMI